jgi:predicted amidohydrolase YtcJ
MDLSITGSRVLSLLGALAATAAAAEPVNVVFFNGDVLPGVEADGGQMPRMHAVAVREGRVAALGSDVEVLALAGPSTERVDLGGHFAMPGFNDAHLHLASGGFEVIRLDLREARSLAELKALVAKRAGWVPPGQWILGRAWDHTRWNPPRLPDRRDLDAVAPHHPVLLTRVDGHIAVANSAALTVLGINRDTPAPAGGKVDRDGKGEPTGILRETAYLAAVAKLPPPSADERRRAAETALETLASSGVTSAQDNSEWDDFLVYEALEKEGRLTARISEWLPFDAPLPTLQERRAHHSAGDPLLHTGMLKGFMDGSLGSRTAALLAPYSDEPANKGIPRYGPELEALAKERAAAGFQIGFHAIGDRAVAMALDAFAAASPVRPRIEHAQVVNREELARFKALEVIASMQPSHLLTDMRWAEQRLGPDRARLSYAWASFLKAGVTLAFGTDYPVESVNPLRGLYSAVTRKDEAGQHSYYPEEKITLGQAVRAYTVGSAYAENAERDKGTLEVGKWADFVVLDRDLFAVPPAELLKARVLRTVVGGKTVYHQR